MAKTGYVIRSRHKLAARCRSRYRASPYSESSDSSEASDSAPSDNSPIAPFPLLQLTPEIILRIATYWPRCRFGSVQRAFEEKILRATHGGFALLSSSLQKGQSMPQKSMTSMPMVTVIEAASMDDKWDILPLLLSVGAKPTERCLRLAIESQETSYVKAILDHMPQDVLKTWSEERSLNPDHTDHFFLIACQKDNLEIVELLLKCGVPADAGPAFDYQPRNGRAFTGLRNLCIRGLMIASREGDRPLVLLLLEHGADINGHNAIARPVYALSPILWAAEYGHKSIVQYLLDNGADVNLVGAGSALHHACLGETIDIIRLLIKKGADVDKGPKLTRLTPLHQAWFLLDRGADLSMVDNENRSALQFLDTLGGRERRVMVRELQERGVFEERRSLHTSTMQTVDAFHSLRANLADVCKYSPDFNRLSQLLGQFQGEVDESIFRNEDAG
ncbi:ankyrin [Gonapodya prolifera JEL478]|uniref:Ankyrin n=1 Tax=Gonapodya prolifera (strain JEL478) TaxID=1344416 RepID=A0A139AK76_GONPJ|nr:ankyrin [Gonapodya prolifera JEL478]|eukprot:KXS17192.1 ankyrin [Gonapodya prolifera JEL478]